MTVAAALAPRVVRRHVDVRGIVQGVGFRPFVYRLARELQLSGFVRNDAAGVVIEVEGEAAVVDAFVARVATEAPPRARVDAVTTRECPVADSGPGFAILDSAPGRVATAIGPDSAVCACCLRELVTPTDRRYRYAFINCTHCGPRYTITRQLPYDRKMTSMAAFPQCPRCLAEYTEPLDRRFHAEPNACPACGPSLAFLDAAGESVTGTDPIAEVVARLAAGAIIAIKGLGGFHLACDARNAAAVARLRARKAREEKPLAVMVANGASVEAFAHVWPAERAMLASPERPIVLLRKSETADALLPGIAPGLAWIGMMLPYTPLQWLLFHEAAGRPSDPEWIHDAQPLALVMTSANPGGEPLVTGNDEALARLATIADGYLVHDRDVVVGCDDSVVRALPGSEDHGFQFVRRARGYTPQAIRLARAGPPVLAVGGYFKNTVCVTRGDEAFVSQHVGDLDNAATCKALERVAEHLLSILDVEPELVVHDLHPDFHSTRFGARYAQAQGVPALGVQHHHAHIAAVVAEHRLAGPVLGLALDGVGLGTDGAPWGGELLLVDGETSDRIGRLSDLRLPGGDRAAREPWRMAAAALARAGRGREIETRFAGEPGAAPVATMLARGLRAPQTTSMGRWFDAAAGLLGVSRRMAFEGQAAMQLEGLAQRHGPVAPDRSLYAIDGANELDLTPLASRLADERNAGFGAALFHATLVAALTDWVARAAARHGIAVVAAGGGCMLNAILADGLRTSLLRHGVRLVEAQAVPPNDGGLSLGQAWIGLTHLTANR